MSVFVCVFVCVTGVGTRIDPTLCRADRMVGQVREPPCHSLVMHHVKIIALIASTICVYFHVMCVNFCFVLCHVSCCMSYDVNCQL